MVPSTVSSGAPTTISPPFIETEVPKPPLSCAFKLWKELISDPDVALNSYAAPAAETPLELSSEAPTTTYPPTAVIAEPNSP